MATVYNGIVYIETLNGTWIPRTDCTNELCPLTYGELEYIPTLGGNLAYLIIFAALLVAQTGLGIYYKTWTFLVGAFCGLLLEIVGYAARVALHANDFNFNAFVMSVYFSIRNTYLFHPASLLSMYR